MFEIERVRDKERKIGYSLHKGTETLVRDKERFEIEGVRDRESQLYIRNRRGPSTEPCGTPHSTVFNDDVTPLTFVNCLRLLK